MQEKQAGDVQMKDGGGIQLSAEGVPHASSLAIKFENVGLCYRRSGHSIFCRDKQLKRSRKYWALSDISFSVSTGESVGVIGKNGSGKSTMAQIIAGVYLPDKGYVAINGKAGLLALGLGFRPELSGFDNIFINASYLGLSRKQIRERLPDIAEFSELGEFLNEPVRTYSSGMKSRLGFAVATTVRPDILVLDEVMATGDQAFRDKAKARLKAMVAEAGTLIVISHQAGVIKSLCSRVIWIDNGVVRMDGETKKVLAEYLAFCSGK